MKLKHMAIAAVLALAAAGLWISLRGGGTRAAEAAPQDGRTSVAAPDARRVVQPRRRRDRRVETERTRVAEEKPVIEISDDEFAEMDEIEKRIIQLLRDALDNNDLAFVKQAVALMKQKGSDDAGKGKRHWSAHVHASLKQAAVDALGWFGSAALEDMTDFMLDEDPDIAQSAIDQFELAMQDPTLADYDRADIIKMIAQILDDADTLDWMFMEALNARHSVGADTLAYIAQNGTTKAKEMLPEYIEMFTGEENITTVSQLENWLAENPDEPDDEEFYGPLTEE